MKTNLESLALRSDLGDFVDFTIGSGGMLLYFNPSKHHSLAQLNNFTIAKPQDNIEARKA